MTRVCRTARTEFWMAPANLCPGCKHLTKLVRPLAWLVGMAILVGGRGAVTIVPLSKFLSLFRLVPERVGPRLDRSIKLPLSRNLSIFGLSPGMTRAQVWERKGAPLGGWSYGHADSATATPVPEWVATDVTSRAVWHYGRFAAIFRGSKLVQVLGEQIEWSALAGEVSVFRGQHAWELLHSKLPAWVLRPVSAGPGLHTGSPLYFRLLPHHFDLSIRPSADSLMRNRLEKSVGLLKVSDQHSQIFVADNRDPKKRESLWTLTDMAIHES